MAYNISKDELRSKCEKLSKDPKILLTIPGYVIRTYSPDLELSVIDHMTKFLINSEPIFSECKVGEDPLGVEESKYLCKNILQHNICLIAVEEDSYAATLMPLADGCITKLAGVNMFRICHKDDPPLTLDALFNSKSLKKVLKTFAIAFDSIGETLYDKYNVNAYIRAAGLAIHKEHEGKGLCKALLQARTRLMEKINVKVSTTLYTSEYSQKAALSCGYTVLKKIYVYEVLDEKNKPLYPNVSKDKSILVTVKNLD